MYWSSQRLKTVKIFRKLWQRFVIWLYDRTVYGGHSGTWMQGYRRGHEDGFQRAYHIYAEKSIENS